MMVIILMIIILIMIAMIIIARHGHVISSYVARRVFSPSSHNKPSCVLTMYNVLCTMCDASTHDRTNARTHERTNARTHSLTHARIQLSAISEVGQGILPHPSSMPLFSHCTTHSGGTCKGYPHLCSYNSV